MSEPDWVEHAIWWHAFPLGFVGGESSALPSGDAPVHRLPMLVGWLDYVIEIGASGLLLGPIFESGSHGYDTIDYLSVDRRLGDAADFTRLASSAHERGIRVMLDGVFNHVGRDFPMFAQALRDGAGSPSAEWFRFFWPADGADPDYEHFEGHRQLVTLNHDNPAVADFVVEVMCHWLGQGADGWRLDAAYAVPAAFWAGVLPRVRERHPEAYFVGEVIHGDYAEYVADSGIDSVTQYELWKATWSALNDRNLFELDWTLTRHNALLDEFVPVTFLGNHDVTRIASQLDDERHLAHAVVLLMTLGGTPCIYAGDEQGFRGVKEDRAGGDDAVRPAFPGSPSELSDLGAPVLAVYRELIALRRRNPWLHCARTDVTHLANEQMVFSSRAGAQSVVVALNISDQEVGLLVPSASEVIVGHGRLDDETTTLTLPAHGWSILST